MRILIMTAMWPTPENPAFGSFVRSQVDCLQKAGLDLEVMLLEGRHRKLMYLTNIPRLRDRLGGFDLVHAHYGYVGIVARTQWQIPVIVTYHGSDLLGGVNVLGKRSVLGRVEAALSQALGYLVDAIVVQNEAMARCFRRSGVHIIPHEVDLELFQPIDKQDARRRLGLCPDKKYLLFAANPKVPVKHFPLAEAVAGHLRARDASVELLVVFREPQPRLALYMNAADALVFPSFQEGSPNIIKQAMACNLPIVATDVGDVKQIIRATQGCYLCSPTVEEFTAALNRILGSPSRTSGRERVQQFSGAIVARQILGVYEEVIGHRAKFAHVRNPHGA